MTTDEMVAGLRELARARNEYLLHSGTRNFRRIESAEDWISQHASAIADEMEMLAEEVKHLKPLAESTLEENERLRAALLNLCAKSFEAYAYIGPEPKPRDQYDQYDRIAAPAWEAAMAALGEGARQWMSKARG